MSIQRVFSQVANQEQYTNILDTKAQTERLDVSHSLAALITKAASKQTYYTVRYLVDQDRTLCAYQAYAYFRWVDDWLDRPGLAPMERLAFIERQQNLVECRNQRQYPSDLNSEEQLLIDLKRSNPSPMSGLHAYIRNMMAVMQFDARRRGLLKSEAELTRYTHHLASAVTEALHYFIGHDDPSPQDNTRYLAATAAHITHMLRDTVEDTAEGYFNIPLEVVKQYHLNPSDIDSDAYRAWVKGRVELARTYFTAGKHYLMRVNNLRCRMAGYAYIARFEWLLDTIQRDGYRLRSDYHECRKLSNGLHMGWLVLSRSFYPVLS